MDSIDRGKLLVEFDPEQELFELVPIESHKNSSNSLISYKILNRKDFEEKSQYPALFLLTVVVKDLAGHNETAKVFVDVIKVNKNLPEIDWGRGSSPSDQNPDINQDHDYQVEITEDTPANTVLLKVNAFPKKNFDDNTQPQIHYTLIQPNSFYKIDETTGEISTSNVTRRAGHRTRRDTTLFVQAYYDVPSTFVRQDNAPLPNRVFSSVAIVDIKLVKEEAPVFIQPHNNSTQIELIRGNNSLFRFECDDNKQVVTFKLLNQQANLTLNFR